MRGVSADQCSKVANALYAGGVRLMEITYNQKDPASWQQTAEAIGALTEEFGAKMLFGAGTVTNVELVELTHAHGGKYIISPDTNVDVIKRTVELGMVSLPGAMTPTEVMTAHDAGADFVKLFPAGDGSLAGGGVVGGSGGRTTAGRMDSYVDLFQSHGGSMIMLAKGNRSQQVTDACKNHGGFYLGSIGGPAAILAQNNIKSIECVEYPELGMEAIWKIEVENFPAFILVDNKGNDFFKQIKPRC